MKEMLNSVTIEPNSVLIITSDNCASQYKSMQHFHHLQRNADEYQVTLVGVYGIACHGKNETDCCGGVVKIRVRREVSRGKCFKTAGDWVSFLNEQFKDNTSPTYSIKLIEKETLTANRKLESKIKYNTIIASSKLRIKPN